MLTFFSLGYQKFMPNPPTLQIDPTYTQKTNLNISASNKIIGNAKVTLKSNSSILLLPNTKGFTAKPISGGSFKAEISPCN